MPMSMPDETLVTRKTLLVSLSRRLSSLMTSSAVGRASSGPRRLVILWASA